jgi:small subunit ribosomal protein S8
MSFNDSVADLLTRIRNATNAKHEKVAIPYSRLKESIVKIICDEGFFNAVDIIGEGLRKSIVIDLKYKADGKPVFSSIHRVSKNGRRQYIAAKEIKPSRQGMGVAILSTSSGVMKDVDAKRRGVGGEVLCAIW